MRAKSQLVMEVMAEDSAVNAAIQGLRQLLNEERRGETSALAKRHCQVSMHGRLSVDG